MTFEQKLERLSEILTIIESNKATLNELTSLYKEATEIISSCNKALSETQLAVVEIAKDFNTRENEEK